jgi:hypothetical protein
MTQNNGSGFKVQGSAPAPRTPIQHTGPGTPNRHAELGTLNPERDTSMTSTYIQVLVLEAVIIVALWLFGRLFS